jgi:hypothetical protein
LRQLQWRFRQSRATVRAAQPTWKHIDERDCVIKARQSDHHQVKRSIPIA